MKKFIHEIEFEEATKTDKFLNSLNEIGKITIEAFFPRQYGFTALGRWLLGIDKQTNVSENDYKKLKEKFYKLLYKLEQENLICNIGKRPRSIWRITKKGKQKLTNYKTNKNRRKIYKKYYSNNLDQNTLSIVSFDIPESEKKKRYWIRQTLIANNFQMLQKSVWISKNKLPIEFMNDIKNLELLSCVHIFNISKSGTIKEISNKNLK